MKRRIKYTVVTGLILIAFSACKNYLDITPKGELLAEKVKDYDLLFNGITMTDLVPVILESATDDYYSTLGTEATSTTANAYFWRDYLDEETESAPVIWLNSFKTQYYCNYIINNVMEATEGTVTEKKTLLAQARTIRAASFLYLLTAFANAYDPAKNPDDPGLPLVTSTNVTDVIPQRSSLKECFDYMINDLLLAIDNLPAQHKDRWRVTKHGAAGLLARVYLYMHDYEKANQYATLALQSSQTNKMLDYNTFPGISSFPAAGLNSEKLWLDYTSIALNAYYSQQLLDLYTAEDLRLKLFSGKNSSGIVQKTGNSINGGISYPEMYLTQAEYLARNDQPDEAMEIVNLLRKNRLPPTAPDLNLSAANAEEALTLVLEERRRELAFSGVRWLDMKRLDQENKMPEVFRYQNNDPDGTSISSLPPGGKGHTFEIPLKVQLLNPTIQLNNE